MFDDKDAVAKPFIQALGGIVFPAENFESIPAVDDCAQPFQFDLGIMIRQAQNSLAADFDDELGVFSKMLMQ